MVLILLILLLFDFIVFFSDKIIFYIFLAISIVVTFQHMVQLHINKLIGWLVGSVRFGDSIWLSVGRLVEVTVFSCSVWGRAAESCGVYLTICWTYRHEDSQIKTA